MEAEENNIRAKMRPKKKYSKSVLGRGLDDIGEGRGLDALIDTSGVSTQGSSNLSEIPVAHIEPNPNQPRRDFDPTALEELAESIRQIGIVQPITVRKVADDRFQIIAGERRWRASQLAGLSSVPAYVRTAEDEDVMEMALVENIQREDLNPIEIALAYERLIEKSGQTQEQVSKRVGKSRAAVANYLRLLKLPAEIQIALKEKNIDMGHARALLSLERPSEQIKLFKDVQKNGFSVRRVEELVSMIKKGINPKEAQKKNTVKKGLPDEFNVLRDRLSQFFSANVQMTCSPKGRGKITIPFNNEEELEKIMRQLDALTHGEK